MTSTLMTFPIVSFRKIESPYEETGEKNYMMVLNVKHLPEELQEWREVNVRDSRLSSGVAKKIAETLQDNPDSFFFKNRGITLIVDRLEFDNKKNVVKIEMQDKHKHGLLDGGHTYSVIKKFLEDLSEEEMEDFDAFVKIEVLEGIKDHEDVVSIVEARNTSTQVREQSIEELRQRYEEIKKILSKEKYANRIAYKEFELLEESDKPKDIDIKEILSYLVCFDVEGFKGDNHPIRAYSTKSAIVSYFKENHDRLQKYLALLPKILELRDTIYLELPDAYNSTGGKFGRLTGVTEVSGRKRMSKTTLPFSEKESSYRIPSGFIYPVLASFRNLVKCNPNDCEWKTDPIRFFRKMKAELASRVCDQAKELRNPNKLGKDKATWGRCYDLIRLEVLEQSL